MKKLFLLAAGLALTLTACQKDEGLVSDGGAAQTITIAIPQGTRTRATAADFGNGAKIDRCLLQIYRNGQPYGEQQTAAVTGNAATFNLRLVASQTYDFVFWADCSTGDHYDTDDLTRITVKGAYAGNDDEFDAFTGILSDYKVTGSFSENITLRRPFGQLNVKTFDMTAIPDPALKPTKVKVAFTAVPTSFDAKKGEVGQETAAVEYTADVLSADGDLTVDYIWAPVEEATLADFSMTFYGSDDTEIATNSDFKNIPIRRNYRTNVSGNLLTKQGTLDVTINPDFDQPDIDDYPELRAALANGGSVALSEDVTVKAPLVVERNKTVEIDLNGKNIINETSLPDGQYGNTTVFEVKGGATLNIRGDGDIRAIGTEPNEDGYRMAVYAYGDAKVNIYGGNFYNDQEFNDGNAQLDLIYADQNAVINIYGGRFESACANERGYWVLNLKDNSNAAINVYGGTFINFDPSNSMTENPVKNFVAKSSTTVKVSTTPAPNGTYEVVPAGGQASVPVEVNDAADLTGALSNPAIAKIAVASDIDLASVPAENLSFTEHKTIDIKEGTTVRLGSENFLTAEKGLTLTGKGTIDNSSENDSGLKGGGEGYQKSLIHVTGGDCVIDGVTLINDPDYHWHGSSATGHPYNSAAIAYWNDANVTIRNARIISGEFTVCGMGRDVASGEITLTDSYFESTSSNKDNGKHWAYAMRLFGSKVRIDNCEVKGIQGGISIESCQDAVISGGKYYTVNTPGEKDAFYPVYITNGAKVTITGGEFSAPNDWSGLQIEGTSAVVSGDNDVNLPTGSVILKGGKFSGKAYNTVTKVVYEPAEGYKWQAIDGAGNQPGDLKWEVVAQSL